MSRRGILFAYRLVAPLVLLCAFIGPLDEFGVIELSERALPGLLYTFFVILMMGLAFSAPVFLVLAAIIVVRIRRDRPVMLPTLILLASLIVLIVPLFAGIDDPAYQWPGGMLFIAFVIAATWAGYFAPRQHP